MKTNLGVATLFLISSGFVTDVSAESVKLSTAVRSVGGEPLQVERIAILNDGLFQADEESAADIASLPTEREIHGGSSLLVTYEGEWPLPMKGAFEYAVKIWEENLPMTLPIRINARMDNLTGSNETRLSVTEVHSMRHKDVSGETDNFCAYPISAVKSSLLQDYTHNANHILFGDVDEASVMAAYDMTITYNRSMVEEFSFDLDGDCGDKYDFVTLALRDIATGFGIGCSFKADNERGTIIFPDCLTPFEQEIVKVIGTDPSQAYLNATGGNVTVAGFELYAPKEFEEGKSLSLMIPREGDALSNLFRYDFDKGTVVRNIYVSASENVSYSYWSDFLARYAGWQYYKGKGLGQDFAEDCRTVSTEVLPYKGAFTFNLAELASFPPEELSLAVRNELVLGFDKVNNGLPESWHYDKVECDNCEPYSPRQFAELPNNSVPCYSIAVQLKEGSWEVLDMDYIRVPHLTIDMQELKLSKPDSEYARSVSGGLKYRLVRRDGSKRIGYTFKVKYFTRSYKPQVPEIEFCDFAYKYGLETELTNEYYIDAIIGINNLEGVTDVWVDHYEDEFDGDFEYSFSYVPEEFRKGYFIASLDRELTTKLIVTSYNKYGQKDSQTLVIPPMGYPDMDVTFKVRCNSVMVEGVTSRQIEQKRVSYMLATPMNTGVPVTEAMLGADRCVDTSSLPKGIYVLTVIRDGEAVGTTKFVK